MRLPFCCCALLLIGVAAESGAGSWDTDLGKATDKILQYLEDNFSPKTDLEKAADKVIYYIEDAWGGLKSCIAGGSGRICSSDGDCNSVLGHCDRTKWVPSCEPTPLAYWLILMATLGCLVVFVFPVTDDREDHCS